MAQLIGLLGGTFDPVHVGHLRLAIEAMEACALSAVRFIPCHQPVHRAPAALADTQRVALLQQALETLPDCVVDTREIDRGGPSYMIDTVHSVRLEYPEAHLCLLMGSDTLQQFTTWHAWQEILTHAHLIVGQRPGYTSTNALINTTTDAQMLNITRAGTICLLSMPEIAVSSTMVRDKLTQQKSIRYLVPTAIESILL